jgi:type III secretory pathway component EscR
MKSMQKFLNEGVEYSKEDYKQHVRSGCRAYDNYIKKHPEFDNKEFEEYVIQNNKADRDSAELNDICPLEIERLSTEFRRG